MNKINDNKTIDCLIIKKRFLNLIFEGIKIWEIRGSRTNKRGKIGLIESGSGSVVGFCEIVDCKEVSITDLKKNPEKHQIPLNELESVINYKKNFAWILHNPQEFKNVIDYKHPKGAIIWVKVNKSKLNKLIKG